ncbi:hypothetical protein [Streptomyces sp. NPDC092307]|uniref:hypothetical protein n=1 Tax=Streptomyces sp. NPDC092307 TaxID=3366013 RepID=UPI003801A8AE
MASAVIAPVMLVGAGVSVADSGPGPEQQCSASHDGYGGPRYMRSDKSAGPNGAASSILATGFDACGEVYFIRMTRTAGPSGASSSVTASSS